MKIAILGSNGQLGTDLCRTLAGDELFPLTRADFDLCDPAGTARVLGGLRPEVVINTTAYHRVDEIEGRADLAFAVNAVAVDSLARWCAANDAALVHFSTDYVFRGDVPALRRESDPAEPLSVYGVSKLAGEHLVRIGCARHFVVRTSGLYGRGGSTGKGGANFVELMLRLGREGKAIRVVQDQVLTPTYTVDLAEALSRLIRGERYGLYHITNSGACSWYEFAAAIFELAGVQSDLSPTTAKEYGSRAARPAYSAFAHEALLAAGLPEMPHWRDALGRYLESRG